jgi:nucleotide-binding universal stress UspA family protein
MYRNILLPIDLPHKESQTKAVAVACELAATFGAKLNAMTVVPDFGMTIVGGYFPKGYEEKAAKEAGAILHDYIRAHVPAGLEVRHIVANGTIYSEILRIATEIEADLIIMFSHRPELRDYLLGPNAARVVRHADCSVLVVRGD